MRNCNRHFDAIAQACRLTAQKARLIAIVDTEEGMISRCLSAKQIFDHRISLSAPMMSMMSYNKVDADLFLGLVAPNFRSLRVIADRWSVRRDLFSLGLALAAYRAKHDQFPGSLDALTSEFLPQVPVNQMTGLPFSYRGHASEFYLQSGDEGDAQTENLPWKAEEAKFLFEVSPRLAELLDSQRQFSLFDWRAISVIGLTAAGLAGWIVRRRQRRLKSPQLLDAMTKDTQ